jgi:hypothetical protein
MKTLYIIGFIVTFLLTCYKRFIAKDEEYTEKFDDGYFSDDVVFLILTSAVSLLSWMWLIVELFKIYSYENNHKKLY